MTISPPQNQAGVNLPAILATIKQMESGNYSAPPNAGGASGAYQFIQSTWTSQAVAAGYQSYASSPAYLAPPPVQDAVASHYVQSILAANNNNVGDVPLTWYYPAAINNPTIANQVPDPQAGNRLTPAQYQRQWLSTYYQIAGGTASSALNPGTATTTSSSTNTAAAQGDNTGCLIGGGGISVPVIGNVATAPCFISWGQVYALEGGAVLVAGGIIMLAGITILVARGLIGKNTGKTITAGLAVVPGVGPVVGAVGTLRSGKVPKSKPAPAAPKSKQAPSLTRSQPGFHKSADDRLADRTADAQARGRANAAAAGPFED